MLGHGGHLFHKMNTFKFIYQTNTVEIFIKVSQSPNISEKQIPRSIQNSNDDMKLRKTENSHVEKLTPEKTWYCCLKMT